MKLAQLHARARGPKAVIEMPCGASGGTGLQGILRLRLCFAFAKHNLRSG